MNSSNSTGFNHQVDEGEKVHPQSRLELSVNPADGTLLTAPLSLVVNTATDALYNDLQNMATGQPLTLYVPSADDRDKKNRIPYTEKSEAMSSLSFQQRRHVLASRIARHVQSLSHISALVASNLPTSGAVSSVGSSSRQPNIYALAQIPPENELSQITQCASQALEHVRTSWVSADTAQDALYFHHDSLWKIRSHPHDVLGSMDVLLKGRWKDISRDVKLEDRYKDSIEKSWDKVEMRERLKAVIRRKLVLGEIGNDEEMPNESFRWNVVLEKDGMAVRLFHGEPRREGDSQLYPIEARLSVLSEENPAPWTLLSVRTRTAVKTGESNHQLELSKEQMFGLHRICERAMTQEEARAKKSQQENENKTSNDTRDRNYLARPLSKLLHMSHVFSLSWQMEILSSQADALRKGSWSSQSNAVSARSEDGIVISPVKFIAEDEQSNDGVRTKPLAYLAIHFWEVDDRNGKPKVCPLYSKEREEESSKTIMKSSNENIPKRLTLEIRAIPKQGLEVSLSGGNKICGDSNHLRKNIQQLLSSLQDPFQLSASDALLSAVVICAERRCRAVREALLKHHKLQTADKTKVLPPWLHLAVECGSISVGVQISYASEARNAEIHDRRKPIVLFRVACDSRSGKFVATFPRSMTLLRRLACNDPNASEIQLLRQAKSGSVSSSSAAERRRAAARAKDSSGRFVREAFLSLTRSIDILGKRVGIGGEWEDVDSSFSSALREKSVMEACGDVCVALKACSGICAMYGIGSLALGVAGGSDTLPDISGGPILATEGSVPFILAPPLAVVMNQELIEHKMTDVNGEVTTMMKLQRELSCVSASISPTAMTLHLFDMTTQVDSVIAPPTRLSQSWLPLKDTFDADNEKDSDSHQNRKRMKLSENGDRSSVESESIYREVDYFAKRIISTWEDCYE